MAHLFDREVGNRASWSFDSRKLFFPSFFFKENQQFRLHIFLRFRYIPGTGTVFFFFFFYTVRKPKDIYTLQVLQIVCGGRDHEPVCVGARGAAPPLLLGQPVPELWAGVLPLLPGLRKRPT